MKTHELEASVKSINQKVKFECRVEGQPPIFVDYIPPTGDAEGYTSLELLLVSLATCLGTAVKVLLARNRTVTVTGFEVLARGIRRTEHPTAFSAITLKLELHATGLSSERFEAVLRQAEAICPVWFMLRNSVKIQCDYQIFG